LAPGNTGAFCWQRNLGAEGGEFDAERRTQFDGIAAPTELVCVLGCPPQPAAAELKAGLIEPWPSRTNPMWVAMQADPAQRALGRWLGRSGRSVALRRRARQGRWGQGAAVVPAGSPPGPGRDSRDRPAAAGCMGRSNRLLAQVINPFPAQLRRPSQPILRDDLMATFSSIFSRPAQQKLERWVDALSLHGRPWRCADVGLSFISHVYSKICRHALADLSATAGLRGNCTSTTAEKCCAKPGNLRSSCCRIASIRGVRWG